MGRMKCNCGAVMVDIKVPNPYLGSFVSDADIDYVRESIADELAELMAASSNDQLRSIWMEKHFKVPPYPPAASNQEMISDLITQLTTANSRCLWQCDSCGRLWLQVKPYENIYRSFIPDEKWNGQSSLKSLRSPGEPVMQRYLYRFGYQTPNQLSSDQEDSQCVWIYASNEAEALSWGCNVAERFVCDRWPDSPNWRAGNYAHWIETQDESALRWAAENAPCCSLGQFPTWSD